MHFCRLSWYAKKNRLLFGADYNMIISIGAFGFGFAQLIFLYIIIKTIKGGSKATDQVWEGVRKLEWTLPSPPPYHSFNTPPDQIVIELVRRYFLEIKQKVKFTTITYCNCTYNLCWLWLYCLVGNLI